MIDQSAVIATVEAELVKAQAAYSIDPNQVAEWAVKFWQGAAGRFCWGADVRRAIESAVVEADFYSAGSYLPIAAEARVAGNLLRSMIREAGGLGGSR